MSTPMPTPSLIPCEIRYSVKENLADFGKLLQVATRKLSTQLPLKTTGADGHPAWMIESPKLHGTVFVTHTDWEAAAADIRSEEERAVIEHALLECKRCIDIKYRAADRSVVEDLAALLGCTQGDNLVDIDARDMVSDNGSATDALLVGSVGNLEHEFHILDMAFASGQELLENYSENLAADIAELAEIRKAIEAGDAEARFGKTRVAQYLREEPKPVTVGENMVDHTLPHTLHIPSDSGMVLRVHYAWDPDRRIHIIGFLDDYAMN